MERHAETDFFGRGRLRDLAGVGQRSAGAVFGSFAGNWRSCLCAIPIQTANGVGGRFEYFDDRNRLYSGTDQALKEFTGTFDYKVGEGFLARTEFRRDWSNVPFFLTNKPEVLSPSQPTFTVGLVWWAGGKQGAW